MIATIALNGVLFIASNLLFGIGAALAFITSPIVLVVAGVAALAAGFYIAWQKSEAFRNTIYGVLGVKVWLFKNEILPN